MDKRKGLSTLFALIFAGEAIFLLPFVLPRIFRPTLLSVFQINNVELGTYFSIYGLVAMASYLFGGTLADRFPARNLMCVALWLTGIAGGFMAFMPGSGTMKLIYGIYGFTSIFLFWAAMIRATREWGGLKLQGRAFGWLEGGRGFIAASLGTFSLLLFSWLIPSENSIVKEGFHAFQYVILAISGVVILSGFVVWYYVPKLAPRKIGNNPKKSVAEIKSLLKLPGIWLLAIIIVCAYVGYKITDDFSLYAREVLGFNEVQAAAVGTGALWVRSLVAIAVGIWSDSFVKIRALHLGFGLAAFGGLFIAFGILANFTAIVLINLCMLMLGVYGVRGLYFAIMKEANIPFALTGTAVGIMSFIGFTPDVFMGPWMGYLLDNNPGSPGHQKVFFVLAVFAFAGLAASYALQIFGKRKG